MKKILYTVAATAMLVMGTACTNDDLDPTLGQDKDLEANTGTENDLVGILNGAYNRMSGVPYYGRDFIIFNEVRADNTYSNSNSNRFVNVAEMEMLATDAYPTDTWEQIYAVIGSANIIIGAEDVEGDATNINHMKGQAYAIRALAHFDLTMLYGQQHVTGGTTPGGVPYITTFRDQDNYFPTRNTADEVKDLAIADLDMALSLMSPSLNDPSKQFITTHGVNAIKARIALYFGDYATAATAAKAVIDSGAFEIAEAADLAATFVNDSASNSIFEIAANSVDNNGINGLANIYRGTAYGDIAVLQDLVDIYEAGDVRVAPEMIDTDAAGYIRNMGKYPTMGTFEDNISVIRYEEIVLIYAEAMLASNPGTALTYLNMIPAKRGASAYGAATLDNILLERRKELAFEGFRFNDLARTGMDIPFVDQLNQTHGGSTYGSENYAFPIPTSETEVNSNVAQNKGW